MTKGCQHGAKIDARTHQKSMPKLVAQKIMKIIICHVFLNGKIIETPCKNNGFEGLAGCVREQKRYQQNIKNDINIHPQINDKSMQNVYSKNDATNM